MPVWSLWYWVYTQNSYGIFIIAYYLKLFDIIMNQVKALRLYKNLLNIGKFYYIIKLPDHYMWYITYLTQ